MKDILNKIDSILDEETSSIDFLTEQTLSFLIEAKKKKKGKWAKAKVKHPGILEVPPDKHVMTLPDSHFITLAKKKGRGAVVKALMNLYRWNKKRNPKLSSWAKKTQEKVSASFEAAAATA